MTLEHLAILLGLLALTVLLTGWISWRASDSRRDSKLITGVGASMAVFAAALGVWAGS